jgi:hypothetical protein
MGSNLHAKSEHRARLTGGVRCPVRRAGPARRERVRTLVPREREEAHESGDDNEFNPGLGLRWRTPGERFDWFLDGGVYRDSGRNTAVYGGIGTFWKPTERLRLGAALVGFHSDTYNEGDAFIAPLPIAGYEWRRVTLNVVYFPKIDRYNEVNTFGFWLTFWP